MSTLAAMLCCYAGRCGTLRDVAGRCGTLRDVAVLTPSAYHVRAQAHLGGGGDEGGARRAGSLDGGSLALPSPSPPSSLSVSLQGARLRNIYFY